MEMHVFSWKVDEISKLIAIHDFPDFQALGEKFEIYPPKLYPSLSVSTLSGGRESCPATSFDRFCVCIAQWFWGVGLSA